MSISIKELVYMIMDADKPLEVERRASHETLSDHEEEKPPALPFRFFDLPFELRATILDLLLHLDRTIDLNPINYKSQSRRMKIFLTSHRMHEEALKVFYGGHMFRLLPNHGRFFGDKIVPLPARLPTRYRAALTSLELRLGPGWGGMPKSWKINNALGLDDMVNVKSLLVFVEVDPSDPVFNGFRISPSYFPDFCLDLFKKTLSRIPALCRIVFESYPSVKWDGDLMTSLVGEAESTGLDIVMKQNSNQSLPTRAAVGRQG